MTVLADVGLSLTELDTLILALDNRAERLSQLRREIPTRCPVLRHQKREVLQMRARLRAVKSELLGDR